MFRPRRFYARIKECKFVRQKQFGEKIMKTMPYNFSSYGTSTRLPSSLATNVNYGKDLSAAYDSLSVSLATKKTVNSSYDNSVLYFKDMRLNERAAGLDSVLDSVGKISTTLSAVDDSISALTELVQQAKASATYAAESVNKPAKMTSEYGFEDEQVLTDISGFKDGDEIIIRTGNMKEMTASVPVEKKMKLSELGIETGDSFNIKVGDGEWVTLKVADEDMRVDAFFGQLTTLIGEDKLKYEVKDGQLKLYSPDRSPILVNDAHYAPNGEIDETNTEPNMASKLGFDLGTTITIREGETIEEFMDELSALDGITASLTSRDKLQITSDYGDDLVIGDLKGDATEFMGIEGGTESGNNLRLKYSEQYDELLKQIDDLVNDSTFDGLNPLKGDNIRAIFNENGGDVRTITGVMLDSESLGLSPSVGDWQDPADIANALSDLDAALAKTRAAANKFEQDAAMVTSRENFLTGLSNTSKNGAELLTKADLNEVSSLLLAIETQQEIANQVISLTLESSANILSMF